MITGQLLYVTAAFVSGIAIMFAYDVLLILREVVKLNLAFIILEDIFFCVLFLYAYISPINTQLVSVFR